MRGSGPAYHSAPEGRGSAPGPQFGQRLGFKTSTVPHRREINNIQLRIQPRCLTAIVILWAASR